MNARQKLQRGLPTEQGIAPSAILAFVEAVEQNVHELHSFMLLRHGVVTAEGWWAPYATDVPHMLFSLSKSFTSTAIGLAVAEGRLSVDDPVLAFFPDDAPADVSENLASMKVRHLLSMSTGHAVDTTQTLHEREDGNWAKGFFSVPVEYAPGTHFLYNTGATYMLSAIIQHLTGITLLEYLRPRLFEPLGIENPTWQVCPRGINTGGYGLNITTEDIAAFVQLYLQEGTWNGKQLVSREWIREATSKQISNGTDPNSDWAQGYGYQFWRCQHGAYRGDGAFGQYGIVMPEQDVAIAITGGLPDMQVVLRLIWEHLLPAFSAEPLPADPAAQQALEQKLASLQLIIPRVQPSSPTEAQISGKRYQCEANDHQIESFQLRFDEQNATLTISDARGTHYVTIGRETWVESETSFGLMGLARVAATGTWETPATYQVKLSFYETPFCPVLRFQFAGDEVILTLTDNVSFGPTEHQPIKGKVSA